MALSAAEKQREYRERQRQKMAMIAGNVTELQKPDFSSVLELLLSDCEANIKHCGVGNSSAGYWYGQRNLALFLLGRAASPHNNIKGSNDNFWQKKALATNH